MVDVTRKHVAPAYRILVDAKAFLNTTISDGVLYFTASQIELMRNLVDYANRRTTFVSDYYVGYYLSPDDTDWDLIQQRVADLEETLMGNPNTLWGYDDQQTEWYGGTKSGAGQYSKLGVAVPAGYIDIITKVYLRNETGARGEAYVEVSDSLRYHKIVYSPGLAQDEMLSWAGFIPIKAGQRVRAIMESCLDGDEIDGGWMGYRMKLPG